MLEELLGRYFTNGVFRNNTNSLVGSWLGTNLSPADLQAARMSEDMAIRADERAYQYDIRGLKESPLAQIEGYEEAGLNPALMYGSTSPTYAQGQGSVPEVRNTGNGLADLIAPLLQVAQIKSIIDERRSNIDLNESRKNLVDNQATGVGLQNTITKESLDSLIDMNRKQPQLLDAKINALIEEAQSEDEKQKLYVLQQTRQQLDNKQFERMMDLVYQAQELNNQILSSESQYRSKILDATLRQINEKIAYMTAQIEYTDEAKKYLKDKSWQQVLGGIINDILHSRTPRVSEGVISTEYDNALDNTD